MALMSPVTMKASYMMLVALIPNEGWAALYLFILVIG
jgi:hypothetical protein